MKHSMLHPVTPKGRWNSYWWMQDGATSHTMLDVLRFLLDKFRGRVISRLSEIIWPPYSPDINILDYLFWLYTMMQVRWRKPTTEEQKETVEAVAHTIPEEMVRNVVVNICKPSLRSTLRRSF